MEKKQLLFWERCLLLLDLAVPIFDLSCLSVSLLYFVCVHFLYCRRERVLYFPFPRLPDAAGEGWDLLTSLSLASGLTLASWPQQPLLYAITAATRSLWCRSLAHQSLQLLLLVSLRDFGLSFFLPFFLFCCGFCLFLFVSITARNLSECV